VGVNLLNPLYRKVTILESSKLSVPKRRVPWIS